MTTRFGEDNIQQIPAKVVFSLFKVWSASSLAKHNPPSDFLWKVQSRWKAETNTTTILSKPNGQV